MIRKIFSKDRRNGDALITTIIVLMIIVVFLIGYLNIASKRVEAHANFNKYVDMKTSMANALHAALIVAINNYDALSDVATELENLDSDESFESVFSNLSKRYSFLSQASPTIFSDVQYLNTVESPEVFFRTAYGYPSVYYLKLSEDYQDLIVSTIKDQNGRIMNYLVGSVEKTPFYDEMRKKVYIVNDTESDPNKKSRFLPGEEFYGAVMTQGTLFFNNSKGNGKKDDDYGVLYFSIANPTIISEIPTEVFLEFAPDFNHTIVASGSEYLWVGPGNNSIATTTSEEIASFFATDSTYSYVGYNWQYLGNNLSANTVKPETIWKEIWDTRASTVATIDIETGLYFDWSDYNSPEIESKVENGYTVITISDLKEQGNKTEKEKLYEIKILPISNSTSSIYSEIATVTKFDEDEKKTNRLVLKNFNSTLYFHILNDTKGSVNNDLIIDGETTNYSNADLKIITNDSIKFQQNFLIYGLSDVGTDVHLSLNDPIVSFVASACIKFEKSAKGKNDDIYKVAGSLYALNGALAYVGNGNGDMKLYAFGQVVEGITIEHIGQGFGSGTKRDIPDLNPNELVAGGGSLKNNIERHFYYDPRLWFVDYFVDENIKRIFIPRYSISGRILNFVGTYGSVIVRLNYMGW